MGCALVVIAMWMAPLAFAKGPVVRITVSGDSMAAPVVITDPSVVSRFSVWNGPGVRVNGEPVHLDPNRQDGRFVDWPKGPLANQPKGGRRYEVAFHVKRDVEALAYRVVLLCEPDSGRGYVYLPGTGEPGHDQNIATILHGVEGNWFHTTAEWERLVAPIIRAQEDRR